MWRRPRLQSLTGLPRADAWDLSYTIKHQTALHQGSELVKGQVIQAPADDIMSVWCPGSVCFWTNWGLGIVRTVLCLNEIWNTVLWRCLIKAWADQKTKLETVSTLFFSFRKSMGVRLNLNISNVIVALWKLNWQQRSTCLFVFVKYVHSDNISGTTYRKHLS